MDKLHGQYPVQQLCQVLGTSRSCYYDWKNAKTHQISPKQQSMEQHIITVFKANKRRYGTRRIVEELNHQALKISRYRVRKTLSKNGLKAIQPRSFVPRTTDSRHTYRISPNVYKERGFPSRINETWVGDITYIPMTGGPFRYLSVWMDLYSRKIVGWDLQDHMKESLVVASLKKALAARGSAENLIIHSDRGGQYAGTQFRRIIDKHKLTQSMSDADNPYDNAHMESYFSRFKAELMEGGAFDSAEDSQTEIFEFIEMYYNPKRLHSSIGYLSPNEFENRLKQHNT
ncbi:IS3 family transposase [Chitinophaga costaii]|uniref:IS3 family transposase n=1 Tax=Chitinophaga costaii TaxID=1335309 RepID=UPI001F0C8FEE|nr:IS3 family transposase [Chitinophaga costaii]